MKNLIEKISVENNWNIIPEEDEREEGEEIEVESNKLINEETLPLVDNSSQRPRSWNEERLHRKEKTKKRFKLETLSRRCLYFILVIMNLFVLISGVIDVFQYKLRIETFPQTSTKSTLQPTIFSGEWNDVRFSNRFLMISVKINCAPISPTLKTLTFDANVYGTNFVSNQTALWDSFKSVQKKIKCDGITGSCEDTHVFFDSHVEYTRYRIEISGNQFFLLNSHDVIFHFTFHSSQFTQMELALDFSLLFITSGFLIFWVLQFCWFHKWSYALPEQKWVLLVLIGVLLYQDPLFFFAIVNPSNFSLTFASDISLVLSSSLYLIFWLLIMDGLSYPPSKHLTIWNFYFSKCMFGFVWFVTLSGCVFFFRSGIDYSIETGYNYFVIFAIMMLILSVCIIIWIIWFIGLFCFTKRKLRRIPFLETRYRQLSFRFFFFLSILVIVYILMRLPWQFVDSSINQDPDYDIRIPYLFSNLGLCLLTSLYSYIIVFIYLPVDTHFCFWKCTEIDREEKCEVILRESQMNVFPRNPAKMFCLEVAAMCFECSLQAYYDSSEERKTTSGAGPLSFARLQKLGLTFYESVSDQTADIHATIFTSARRIVVAFRGTASYENAITDLSIRTVEYPHAQHGILDIVDPPLVHGGFFGAFKTIRTQVLQCLLKVYNEKYADHQPNIPIYFTGHSLGGAMTSFMALEAKVSFSTNPIYVYSFGSSRIGNRSFAKLFNKKVPNCFRVVNGKDVVTSVPKFFWLFKHFGNEILIDKRGNIISDLSQVERTFSSSKTSFNDHTTEAYRKSLESVWSLLNEEPSSEDPPAIQLLREPYNPEKFSPEISPQV